MENVLQRAAEMAQIILQLNDYVRTNIPLRALEHYFLNGDEYSLIEAMREIEVEALVASGGDASDGG